MTREGDRISLPEATRATFEALDRISARSVAESPSPEFRPEFVEGIVTYFEGIFPTATQNERAHAVGVIANTLLSLGMNNDIVMTSPGAARDTLDLLPPDTVESIHKMITTKATARLQGRTFKLVGIIGAAFNPDNLD